MTQDQPTLSIQDLRTSFFTEQGEVRAVDGISFDVYSGKTLCLVGESGCGKSVTSLSMMRLISSPPGKIMGGKILYQGKNILDFSPSQMRGIRGNEISMIFQEPMTSLNPVFTVGDQIIEVVQLHQGLNYSQAKERAIEMLKLVGIPAPSQRVNEYPHQLSGGMRQRVMIAMALSCNPKVLIADEPTTALDVTIQAQILDLLRALQKKTGLALILITHDLGVVAEMADEVAVMYAGQIVEKAPVKDIFSQPKHPYTRGLLKSIPDLESSRHERLKTIPGIVPDLLHLPKGCRFQDRCEYVTDLCKKNDLPLRQISTNHWLRCIKDLA